MPPYFSQHNSIIISHSQALVNIKLYQSDNFYDVYKKILLSFYNLPIAKAWSMCYNKDTKEVQSDVHVNQTNFFMEVRSDVHVSNLAFRVCLRQRLNCVV